MHGPHHLSAPPNPRRSRPHTQEEDEAGSISHGGEGGEEGDGEGKKSKNEGLTGQILSLAIPALVALSVDPLMSAVDTAYIGRLGTELGGGAVRERNNEGKGEDRGGKEMNHGGGEVLKQT